MDRAFAVLWDLDGVLVDTRDWHYASWKRVLSEHGKQLSEWEFRDTFGQRSPDTIRMWLPGASEQQVQQIANRKESYFRGELPPTIPLLPGVARLVNDLAKAAVPQVIASSAPAENLRAMLPRMQLPIGAFVSGEDVAQGKPDPEVFLAAAERASMPPGRCVVVEDAVAGVEAAHRAGMACVAVTTTWPADRLAAADLVVPSLEGVSVADLARIAIRD